MGQRRKARECALQILFQLEFNSADPKDLIKVYWEHQKASREVREYGTWIVETMLAHGKAIDAAIQTASKNWRLTRMAVVDRNILRIAVCELLYGRTLVPAIVMDEAIEIAKRYSGEESAVFVNGVLDAVVRSLGAQAAKAAEPAEEGKHEH
ncbi:MAG: transcription antitermination factor NusB [Candidatus Aminicenantales bacterium]